MEPIRLWREGGFHEDGSPGWWNYNDMGGLPIPEAWTEYAALPRADFGALVRRALAFNKAAHAAAKESS